MHQIWIYTIPSVEDYFSSSLIAGIVLAWQAENCDVPVAAGNNTLEVNGSKYWSYKKN